MAFAPANFLGAARIAYAPDDAIAAPASTPDATPAAAEPAAAPVTILAADPAPAPAAAVVDPAAAPVADPPADPAAPAVAGDDDAPDITGLSPEDAEAVKEAWEAKQAEKAARKAELEKMTPEDRAKAEADDAAAEAEEARLATVPEDGKYDLKMPDGVSLNEDLLAAISPDLAALALSNGQAQQLADTFIKAEQARSVQAAEDWAKTLNGWVETAKADPHIGGAKWDATVKDATRAIGKFGSPELKAYLELTGGGNNPEMIRAWAKVGAAIGDDNATPGDPGGKPVADTDKAAVLYPNDTPKGK